MQASSLAATHSTTKVPTLLISANRLTIGPVSADRTTTMMTSRIRCSSLMRMTMVATTCTLRITTGLMMMFRPTDEHTMTMRTKKTYMRKRLIRSMTTLVLLWAMALQTKAQ